MRCSVAWQLRGGKPNPKYRRRDGLLDFGVIKAVHITISKLGKRGIKSLQYLTVSLTGSTRSWRNIIIKGDLQFPLLVKISKICQRVSVDFQHWFHSIWCCFVKGWSSIHNLTWNLPNCVCAHACTHTRARTHMHLSSRKMSIFSISDVAGKE